MKSLKYIFFLVLAIFIGASIYVATLDGNFNINQSRTMKVPIEMVYKNINDFKNWENWGPWYETDPTIVTSFPENTSGVGAYYSWTGKVGNGSIKTISVIPNKEIIQEIDYGSDSTSEVYWQLEKISDSTKVTWGIKGKNTFEEKIYWLINGGIEKSMTPMYKNGLKLLETALLKEMDAHSIEYKGVVDHGGGYYLYQTVSCRNEDVTKNMTRMLPEIVVYMNEINIEASGKPFTLSHQVDFVNKTTMFSICIPIKERIITEGAILTGYLEPQTTFKVLFKGNYKFLANYWPQFYKKLNEDGFTPIKKGFSFEVYTINPVDTPNPAEWLTEIYIPLTIEKTSEIKYNEII